MKFRKLIDCSPWIVGITGLFVIFGRIIDSRLLIQIYPSFTSMKFFTALLFLCFGFQLFEIKNYIIYGSILRSKFYFILMTLISLIIVFCFFMYISPKVFGGILSLVPINEKYDPWTTMPHIPSILTLLCFALIQFSQYIIILYKNMINKVFLIVGISLCFLSGVVVLSYVSDIQWVSFTTIFGGAMAIHSAILFVIIGINFLVLRSNKTNYSQ